MVATDASPSGLLRRCEGFGRQPDDLVVRHVAHMLIKRPSMAERIDELSGPVVENWRTDPRLTALWLQQMQSFTDATIAQIRSDPHASARLAGHDIPTVASTLTWLGERVYYLAALGTPPFDNEDTLVDTLLHIWTSTLYGAPADPKDISSAH